MNGCMVNRVHIGLKKKCYGTLKPEKRKHLITGAVLTAESTIFSLNTMIVLIKVSAFSPYYVPGLVFAVGGEN